MAAFDFQDPNNSQYLALLARGLYTVPSSDPFDAVSALDDTTKSVSKILADAVGVGDSVASNDGSYTPKLDFSDPRNSQYLKLILLGLTRGPATSHFDAVSATDVFRFSMGRAIIDSVVALDATPMKAYDVQLDDAVAVGDFVPSQGYTPSLNFSDPRNSQYLKLILLGRVPASGWLHDTVYVYDTMEPDLGRTIEDQVTVTDDPVVRLDRELVQVVGDEVFALDQFRPHIYTDTVRPLITRLPLASTAFGRPVDMTARAGRTLGRNWALGPADFLQPEDTAHVVITATERFDGAPALDTVAKHMTRSIADTAAAGDVLTELNHYPPKPIDPVVASDAVTLSVQKAVADGVAAAEVLLKDVLTTATDAATAADEVVAGRAERIGFITESSAPSGAVTLALPVGAQVNDLCIIMAEFDPGSPAVTSSTGWSVTHTATAGFGATLFTKQLTSTDITNGGVTIIDVYGGTALALMCYRGVTTATIKTTGADATAATYNLTGITKAAGCRAIVSLLGTREPASPAVSAPLTKFAQVVGGLFYIGMADLLDPSFYTNGTAVSWTSLSSSIHHGYILELT